MERSAADTMSEVGAELSNKVEQAEELVTEGIGRLRSKMASGGGDRTYGPPTVPSTPSPTINKALRSRCDRTFDNPLRYGLAWAVCLTFGAIVNVYGLLTRRQQQQRQGKESYRMWLVSCAIGSVLSVLAAVVFYYLAHALTFVVHVILFYACIAMGLFGVGLATSGALFFDKSAAKSQ